MKKRPKRELVEKTTFVTYDLAIANPASQIQDTETPHFDNVLTMLGPFHIMLCYYSCFAFLMDGSGGDTIHVNGVNCPGWRSNQDS